MPIRLFALLTAGTLLTACSGGPPAPPATGRTQVSLLVTGGTVVTMDGGRQVFSPGAVAVQGDAIVAVGPAATIGQQYAGTDTIDTTGRIVLPGLINTHTHAPMVLYRGLSDDLALMDWLQKYIFPAEAKTVSTEFVRAGTRLAALEMIRSGTTLFTDMYYFEEEIAAATKEAGLRGVLGQTVIQFPVADAKTPAEALTRADAYIRKWKGDALVTPAVAPHSMYTLDAPDLTAVRDLARLHDVPVLIHLEETRDEDRISLEKHKMSPTAFLESIGFWDTRVLAAHGVWVAPEDFAVLHRHGVGVAHNPESNMKLASGTAPVEAMRAAGIDVGLGTDGAASNNDLDMFEAMRQTAFLHKHASGDPRAMPASVALELATIGGAKALGMDKLVGSLEGGKKADLIVVSMDAARQVPLYDPVSHLVYVTRGDDVNTTIVNGRVLMRDGRVLTLDEAAVVRDARAMGEKVRAAVAR
jgi:5-methylthioadenosine/S-adenosylhomocysteine deaminase